MGQQRIEVGAAGTGCPLCSGGIPIVVDAEGTVRACGICCLYTLPDTMSCSNCAFHGGFLKYLKVILSVTFTAFVLSGCGGTSAETAVKSATESPASPAVTATAEPNGSASHPFDFGEYSRSSANSQWNVTLTDPVVDGGSALVIAENPYNEVKEGRDYVLGRINSVVNESLTSSDTGEPVSPTSVMPVFVGSDGRIYEIWNSDNSAVVLDESWTSQPDIISKPGIESSGRFAIQVPSAAIPGGQFATRNQVEGTIVYFGEPVKQGRQT